MLSKHSPPPKSSGGLAATCKQARPLRFPNPPPLRLYLALLVYPLTNQDTARLISFLRLPKFSARTLRDTIDIKAKLPELADPDLSPSGIYRLLHGYSPQAVTANSLAGDSPLAHQHIQLFLDKLRYVKSALTGNDLQKMGIAPGPKIKEILQRLHQARLDRKATSRKGEVELVEGWVS